MKPLPLTLTIEQEFTLAAHSSSVQKLSADQARDMLVELMRQLMIKDNVVRHLIKEQLFN